MKKSLMAVVVSTIATTLALVFFAYDYWQDHQELKQADKAVYQYIKAAVEGDDDLYRKVTVKDAHGILETGHHAFPNNAKNMKERYFIKRFDHDFKDNTLYYYIEYYSPAHDMKYADNLEMIKDQDGKWKSDSLLGIDGRVMKDRIKGHEKDGVIVHSYKEGENVER